jgi:hypothetical protein
MWWLWILVIVVVIAGLVMVLNRRSSTGSGDPSYRPNDPRSGQGLGSSPPGQWGPGDGGGGL